VDFPNVDLNQVAIAVVRHGYFLSDAFGVTAISRARGVLTQLSPTFLAGRSPLESKSEGNFAELLDRRLKRLEEMKLIEVNGAKVIDAKPQPVETKPPLARTNDRRFRRF
jgi:hypothetical protein